MSDYVGILVDIVGTEKKHSDNYNIIDKFLMYLLHDLLDLYNVVKGLRKYVNIDQYLFESLAYQLKRPILHRIKLGIVFLLILFLISLIYKIL